MVKSMIKVITYHYVKPTSDEFPHLKYLSVSMFQKQLDFFEKEYGFISKKSFELTLKKKQIVEPGVLLTFDDGLLDHYQWVYPELLKRNLWGLFFICTGHYQKKQLLGVHRVHSLLGAIDSKQVFEETINLIQDHMLDHHHIKEYDKYIYKDQVNIDTFYAVKRLFNYFIKYEFRDKILDLFMHKYFNEQMLFDRYYMSADEIKEMKNYGMIFGCHGESHRVLNRLDNKVQENEILGALDFLEKQIGLDNHRIFCYPYGGPSSYNDYTLEILKNNNIECAFDFDVTNSRDISESELKTNLYTLPRYDCNRFYDCL